jgi:hypothetical protein
MWMKMPLKANKSSLGADAPRDLAYLNRLLVARERESSRYVVVAQKGGRGRVTQLKTCPSISSVVPKTACAVYFWKSQSNNRGLNKFFCIFIVIMFIFVITFSNN